MLLFRFSIFGLVELMVAVAISIAIKALFLQSIGMGDILLLIVFAMLFELEIWLGGLFFTGICSLLAGLLYRTVKRVDIRPSSKIAFAPFLFGGFTLAALLIPSIL
jgi:membrane protein implicated in regulation of membrane protease activity